MKIAQVTHTKQQSFRRKYHNHTFSERLIITNNTIEQDDHYEINLLFKQIEDMLKLFKIMHFRLDENNSREYNNSAIFVYSDLVSMYSNMIFNIESTYNKHGTSNYERCMLYKLKDMERK